MAREAADTERILHDYVAWENGDSSKLDVMSESVDAYEAGLPGGAVHSRDEWKTYFDEIHAAFPDYEVRTVDELTATDMAMHEVEITATHRGEFKGIPATGREVEIDAMAKYRIDDGRIVEIRQFYDTAELQSQLGLTFPEIVGQLPKLAWGKLRAVA